MRLQAARSDPASPFAQPWGTTDAILNSFRALAFQVSTAIGPEPPITSAARKCGEGTPHRLQNGAECFRATGEFGESVRHEAVPNESIGSLAVFRFHPRVSRSDGSTADQSSCLLRNAFTCGASASIISVFFSFERSEMK
jgi:hypothetical protein